MKYYDDTHKRLVFISELATAEFWDQHWDKDEDLKSYRLRIMTGNYNSFILKWTKKYLTAGKILEGGCGIGSIVCALQRQGYDPYGVDFAIETIKKTNAATPEIKVFCADVMYLPFQGSTFDGYWSLGVIEHFYSGYELIADEMMRVLKPGSILFLAFPYLSPIRQLKGVLGLYHKWDENNDIGLFYQFALNKNIIIQDFKKRGFNLLREKPFGGLTGLVDEIGTVESFILQGLKPDNDYTVKPVQTSGIRYLISRLIESILGPFTGYSVLLIFKKKL